METERRYELEAWREPSLQDGFTRIYSEHGRILGTTCYRAYWFALDKGPHGGRYTLVVKHGAGEERFELGYSKRIEETLAPLDSDGRFFVLHQYFSVWRDAKRTASENTEIEYKRAFAEGRLRKRKLRGQDAVKVWVDRPALIKPAQAH